MYTFTITIQKGSGTIYTVKTEKLATTFKIDESLDTALLIIPFTTKDDEYQRFSTCDISISDGTTTLTHQWLVYSDQIAIGTSYPIRYDHTIGLIEPTKLLEKIPAGSLCDTQPLTGTQRTMYDVLYRVQQLCPFVDYDNVDTTRAFTIDTDLKTKLEEITSPQFYFDKKNLREVLIEIFTYINAIPRLIDGVLSADFINNRQLLITPSKMIDYADEVSGEYYASKVESYQENVVSNNNTSEPNVITEYINFRSDEIIVGESNMKLILTQEVEQMVSIKLYLVTTDELNDVTEVEMNGVYAFEKNVYDSFEVESGQGTKSYSFYWEKGSNTIDGLNFQYGALFPFMAIENILIDLSTNVPWYEVVFKVSYIPRFETMRVEQYREDISVHTDDTTIQINQNERINDSFKATSNLYGQIQRIGVDTLSFSKVHKYLAPYDETHQNGIYSLGDYTSDGYFITTVELSYNSYYIVARYEMSKNWNRLAQFLQIDKEFRPYEISLVKTDYTLKRDIIIPIAFIEISSLDRMSAGDVSKYSYLYAQFLKTFQTSIYDLPAKTVLFRKGTLSGSTVTIDDDGVIQPLSLVKEKNTIKLKAGFNNTKLAGNKATITTELGSWVQKQIPYTEDDGTLEFVFIQLYQKYWNWSIGDGRILEGMSAAARLYPYVDTSKGFLSCNGVLYDAVIYTNVSAFPAVGEAGVYYLDYSTKNLYVWNATTEVYNLEDFITAIANGAIYSLPYYQVLKDKAEILDYELTMPIIPYKYEINTFVIGNALIKENVFLKERTIAKTFYFCTKATPFSKNDTEKPTVFVTLEVPTITNHQINVPHNIYYNHYYYGIVDGAGNFYLGVNQKDFAGNETEISTIYFNFLNERTI
ncbi:MAG: hypothetical protein M0R51_08085 [Clostridia bacterium]|jgi:hypothetical protein|nr:hypothetical protein [Clostridia bacterium]